MRQERGKTKRRAAEAHRPPVRFLAEQPRRVLPRLKIALQSHADQEIVLQPRATAGIACATVQNIRRICWCSQRASARA